MLEGFRVGLIKLPRLLSWKESNRMRSLVSFSFAAWVALALFTAPLVAAEIGQIKTTTGQVFLLRNNAQRPAKPGDLIEAADVIITAANSSVGVTLIDNSRLSAGPDSRVEFKQFRFNPTTQEGESLTQLHRGTLAIVSGQIAKRSPDAMKVQTPTTILGVRGTKFAVKVED
jgi:hypothetical protein